MFLFKFLYRNLKGYRFLVVSTAARFAEQTLTEVFSPP